MNALRTNIHANPPRSSLRDALRSVGEGLLELAWPTRCIGCDLPGTLLCDACRDALPRIDPATACKLCGAPYGSIVCTECWDGDGFVEHPFAQAVCALEFEGIAPLLITGFKDGGELRLAQVIAELMAASIAQAGLADVDALVPVPATPKALRRRGYDHMALVAQPLSDALGIACTPLLEACDVSDQRGLERTERQENMRDAFSLTGPAKVEGLQRVLLVDDVFTTGSTLDAAAHVLQAGGVGEVIAAAACRVW